ncbi:PREDICTED: galanin receptor type 1-like [Acropora digitifera]|uniref:galanin receptor type 1-like n=1 Tax=Acropora digitifera TaxID=70779 RepID=UPI00077AD4EB|nr:PREDICTED: galanin receptor type 1-like [Acropora digitifera]
MNNSNATSSDVCVPGPAMFTWSLRLVYAAIFLLGVFGNAVVCFAILKRKAPQNSCNVFTFNLAFHDLFLVVLYVPTQMIVLEHCFTWILGNFMCHLVNIILPICQSASIGTLLAITADRYRAIVFPVKSRLTRKTVLRIIAAIWVGSMVSALPLVFNIKEVSPDPGVVHCVEDWSPHWLAEIYWVSMFVIQYLLPLSAISILAAITAYSLKKSAHSVAMESCAQSEMLRKTVLKRVKQTKRITKMLIALVLLYAICMLPQHVVYTFWTVYGDLGDKAYREHANIIANIFPIANSALNALAYGTLNKEFHGVFKALFHFICCNKQRARQEFARGGLQQRTLSTNDATSKMNPRRQFLLQKNGREMVTMSPPLSEQKQKQRKTRGKQYSPVLQERKIRWNSNTAQKDKTDALIDSDESYVLQERMTVV